MMITQRDYMKKDILLKLKIGLRLSRAGHLSKLFAIQTFKKSTHDLRPEQFTVLYALKEHNGMYLRQLGDITYKDRPNMTRICSILEDKGYLTSEIDAEGRQVKKLYITQKGRYVCDSMLPVVLNVWQESIKGLAQEEIDNFLKTLDKIEENMKSKTLV